MCVSRYNFMCGIINCINCTFLHFHHFLSSDFLGKIFKWNVVSMFLPLIRGISLFYLVSIRQVTAPPSVRHISSSWYLRVSCSATLYCAFWILSLFFSTRSIHICLRNYLVQSQRWSGYLFEGEWQNKIMCSHAMRLNRGSGELVWLLSLANSNLLSPSLPIYFSFFDSNVQSIHKVKCTHLL